MRPLGRNSYVAADRERVRRITTELNALAREGKLTMTRYFELSLEALQAADGDRSALDDINAFVERVQPDYDRLREISAVVARLERDGAMTPIRYASALEQARVAVGPNGSRFVEGILSTGLERPFVEELMTSFDE